MNDSVRIGIGGVAREPLHTRRIEIHGYKREDGLYDVEGHLVDTKPFDFRLAAGVRPAGEAIHGMWLRITLDRTSRSSMPPRRWMPCRMPATAKAQSRSIQLKETDHH